MTWAVVARKEFRDARLSRALWGVTALFVLLAVGFAVLYATVPEIGQDVGEVSSLGYLTLLMAAVTLFVSIASVLVAAGSIAGERESGSGKLLLGLPNSRRAVVLGKLAGRAAVLAAAILAGLALSLAAAVALFDAVSLTDYALFTALTLLFALSYVGIMVGLSATTASAGRAFALGVGAFVALELLADLLPAAALFVTNGFSLAGVTTVADWIAFLNVVVPSGAYTNAVGWFLGGASLTGATTVPFYLSGTASLAVLAAWLVVPVALGYRRFARADL